MLDSIMAFLEGIKWYILLAIAIAGFIFIYWGSK